MFFFKTEDEIRIDKAVSNIKNFLVKELTDKGMISLILVGTIISKKERNKNSDIDFFAIAQDDFNFQLEAEINKKLDALKNDICLGFECRIRCFDIDFLKGGKPKNSVHEFITAARLVQRLPFYKVVWGKEFDYEKEFVEPMKLEDEARHLIHYLKSSIEGIKKDNYSTSMHNFPKLIVELVRVEAQLNYGFTYHPYRYKLVEHLKKQEGHILHKAMKFRDEFETRTKEQVKEDALILCREAEKYIDEFTTLLDKKEI